MERKLGQDAVDTFVQIGSVTYMLNTEAEIAAAQAALGAAGLESAPIYAGDPDGDAKRSGNALLHRAPPRAPALVPGKPPMSRQRAQRVVADFLNTGFPTQAGIHDRAMRRAMDGGGALFDDGLARRAAVCEMTIRAAFQACGLGELLAKTEGMSNGAMARELMREACIDVRVLAVPGGAAGPTLFELSSYSADIDYCDATTERWIWSIGREKLTGKFYAATDTRFMDNAAFELLWLR